MNDNLKQMTRIVDALSGLQKASEPQNLMSVDLADLAKQVLARFEGAAEKDSVGLSVEFQQEPLFVRVDPEHILQVFDVLLSNAVRYSAGGSVTIQIDVGREWHGTCDGAVIADRELTWNTRKKSFSLFIR